MTKYRLKDKEKQQALEKALPGFSELLQEGCERDFGLHSPDVLVMGNSESVADLWEISIPKVWIDKIEEYDASAWNSYPDVIPPEGELMRVEFNNLYGQVVRCCAIFCFGKWVNSTKHDVEVKDVFRFRPWED